jgi:PAS domain S-box-containing protein
MAEPTRRKPHPRTKHIVPAFVDHAVIGRQTSSRSRRKAHTSNTERLHAVDDLRVSEIRFRTLAECAPVVVWMTDAERRCTYVSRYWHEFTGRDPQKDLGFGWVEALHPDDRENVVHNLTEASRSLTPCRGEYRVRRANGELGWLYYFGAPHLDADGTYAGHIGTCIDITHHKAAEKAGVERQNSLVLGQEAERKRLAGELHDDIVQKLALVGLELSETERLCPSESAALGQKLKALRQQVQSIALDVHRISHNLHPAAFVHLGLVSALRRLCREFSEQTRIAIHFTSDASSLEAPAEIGIALYRVAQEGLTNIARHSGSHRAEVSLTERSGVLDLTISDSGTGFDPERITLGPGLGLVSIRERARMIGADVQITSLPRQGTTIKLRIPREVLESTLQIGDGAPPSGV